MKSNIYFFAVVIIIILGLSYYQSQQRQHMYDNTPTMQLQDAGQELMDRRETQDSIDKANEGEAKEEQDRDEYNDYIREQNQPQQVEERNYPICNGCGNEIKSKVYYIGHHGGSSDYMVTDSYLEDSTPYHQICAEKEVEYRTNRNQ